jgi:hypothetical protein
MTLLELLARLGLATEPDRRDSDLCEPGAGGVHGGDADVTLPAEADGGDDGEPEDGPIRARWPSMRLH